MQCISFIRKAHGNKIDATTRQHTAQGLKPNIIFSEADNTWYLTSGSSIFEYTLFFFFFYFFSRWYIITIAAVIISRSSPSPTRTHWSFNCVISTFIVRDFLLSPSLSPSPLCISACIS